MRRWFIDWKVNFIPRQVLRGARAAGRAWIDVGLVREMAILKAREFGLEGICMSMFCIFYVVEGSGGIFYLASLLQDCDDV